MALWTEGKSLFTRWLKPSIHVTSKLSFKFVKFIQVWDEWADAQFAFSWKNIPPKAFCLIQEWNNSLIINPVFLHPILRIYRKKTMGTSQWLEVFFFFFLNPFYGMDLYINCFRTFVWYTKCEEPTIKSMDVCVVLHFYGNGPSDVPKSPGRPPTAWWAVKTHIRRCNINPHNQQLWSLFWCLEVPNSYILCV